MKRVCVCVYVYIAIFALKLYEGYKPDYAAPQRCSNFILSQQIWIMWASLMDICQTLILLGLNFLFSSTVFRLASFSTLASPVSLRNLLASRRKKKCENWFSGSPQHQSWCYFVGSPRRKWSPAEAHIHQTARQCGVPTSSWRESKRGGVQLRGPGTPTTLLQVTRADMALSTLFIIFLQLMSRSLVAQHLQ